MTAKEYLQEIRKFDRYIEQKQIEYDSLYRLRGGAGGIDYSKDKVQTSPDGQGFPRISDRLVDLQSEINEAVDRFCQMKHERIDQIQQLPKVEYSEILFKRYVEYKSFEQIAYEMNYTYKYICQLHGEALIEFGKKFMKKQDKTGKI